MNRESGGGRDGRGTLAQYLSGELSAPEVVGLGELLRRRPELRDELAELALTEVLLAEEACEAPRAGEQPCSDRSGGSREHAPVDGASSPAAIVNCDPVGGGAEKAEGRQVVNPFRPALATDRRGARRRWPLYVAAVAAAAILVVSGLHVMGLVPTRYTSVDLFNVTGAPPLERELPDGTLVTVAPGAKAVARGRDDARGIRQLIILKEGGITVRAPKAPAGETAVRVETPEGLWVETVGTVFTVTRAWENEKGERNVNRKKLTGIAAAVLLVAVAEGQVRTGSAAAEGTRVARGRETVVRTGAPGNAVARSEAEKLPAEVQKALTKEVSLQFEESPLKECLEFLQEFSNVNLVVHRDEGYYPDLPITMRLEKVSAGTALDWVLQSARLRREYRNEALHVLPRRKGDPEPALERDEAFDKTFRAAAAKKVNFEFVDTPVFEAVNYLRGIGGFNLVVDPACHAGGKQKVSLKATRMSLRAAFDNVLDLAGLKRRMGKGAVYLTPKKPAGLDELKRVIAKWRNANAPDRLEAEKGRRRSNRDRKANEGRRRRMLEKAGSAGGIVKFLRLLGTERIHVDHAPKADFKAGDVKRLSIQSATTIDQWLLRLGKIPPAGKRRMKLPADASETRIEFWAGGKRIAVLRARAGFLDAPEGSGWDFYVGEDNRFMKLLAALLSPKPGKTIGLDYVQLADPYVDSHAAATKTGKPYFVGLMGVGFVVPLGSRKLDGKSQVPGDRKTVTVAGKQYDLRTIAGTSDAPGDEAEARRFKRAWQYARAFNDRMLGAVLGEGRGGPTLRTHRRKAEPPRSGKAKPERF